MLMVEYIHSEYTDEELNQIEEDREWRQKRKSNGP